jgi:hypothetical protein
MPTCPGCNKDAKYLIKSRDENGLTFGYCLSCLQAIEVRMKQRQIPKGVTSEKVPQKATQTADLS